MLPVGASTSAKYQMRFSLLIYSFVDLYIYS